MEIFGLKFGLRNLKTGICVFICILISILLKREAYVVSAITAIFTLREDQVNTLKYGRHRVVGTVLGAVFAVICIMIFSILGDSSIVQLFTIPLLIMLMIALLVKIQATEGTVGACATFLTIMFMIPSDSSYTYAFNRVIDSLIGMSVAMLINILLPFLLKKWTTNPPIQE